MIRIEPEINYQLKTRMFLRKDIVEINNLVNDFLTTIDPNDIHSITSSMNNDNYIFIIVSYYIYEKKQIKEEPKNKG